MSVALLTPVNRWYCPNCHREDVTHEARPHTRMHTCPKARGLTTPMLREGTRAKVTITEREDYVGGEQVTTDDEGRPVQSVVTERDDGQDVAVYAPAASMHGRMK